jgi:hypothetical protein
MIVQIDHIAQVMQLQSRKIGGRRADLLPAFRLEEAQKMFEG